MQLLRSSKFVVTDSGGIQEETTLLGIPCLTVRPNTERPLTISEGTNRLSLQMKFRPRSTKFFAGNGKRGRTPPLWDVKTAERMVKILEEIFAEIANTNGAEMHS